MKIAKNTVFWAIALFMLLPLWVGAGNSSKSLEDLRLFQPLPVPNENFYGKDNEKYNLNDFKDKVVVLNFWATWCVPCHEEMPSLDKLAGDLVESNPDIKVIAVSEDFNGIAVVEKYLKKNKFDNLEAYTDKKNKLYNAFNIKGLPGTIFIKEGNEVARIKGSVDWNREDIREFILGL